MAFDEYLWEDIDLAIADCEAEQRQFSPPLTAENLEKSGRNNTQDDVDEISWNNAMVSGGVDEWQLLVIESSFDSSIGGENI